MATLVAMSGKGLDKSGSASTTDVATWVADGYKNIFRNTLSSTFAQDYDNCLAGGLQVALFQGYYTPAYTDETGAQRAQQAIDAVNLVGYPAGAYIFVDIEETGTATEQYMIDWINSWCKAVQAAGYGAGVYFGANQPVSAYAAYYDTVSNRYWKSCSTSSITPDVQGCCVIQTECTSSVDYDTFGADSLGDYCMGARA